jgi:galactosyl transferase GMA12/MNN10 family
MTWAVVQYDNRPLTDDFLALQKRNKEYCRVHGYKYIFVRRAINMPVYWIKVRLVQQLLETRLYKGVLWLDMDAVIHNIGMSLDGFVVPGKAFYYSTDPPDWGAKFNAGVWLVLGTAVGRHIMKSWFESYDERDWVLRRGKWTTAGQWAGPVYEQGSFVENVMPIYEPHLRKIPWRVLQDYVPAAETFVLHFAGPERKKFIRSYADEHL